jgi:excinuclease UvrABC helicase subunit UvrB
MMDIHKILKQLPHRFPFLLVDRVLELEKGKRIKALERQMLEHAKSLEFEKAARVRDQLALLREQAFGASVADVVPLVTPMPRQGGTA